jgi:hypothetical protein
MSEVGGVRDFVESFGGDAVSDGYIPLSPKGVIGEGMDFEVLSQISVCPIE